MALLTTFYMMRVIFVVFFGKSRSHSSEHATEVGGLMLVSPADSGRAGPHLRLRLHRRQAGALQRVRFRKLPYRHVPFYVPWGALVLGILLAAVF